MARGVDTGNHPGRQVGRSSFSDALAIRDREYRDVEVGAMTDEQARRVGIDPEKVRSRVSGFSSQIRGGTP